MWDWDWLAKLEPEDWIGAAGIAASVLVAYSGYLLSHRAGMRRQRLAAELAYVSMQVERLYGPLYSLVQSNTASWQAFRKTFRPNQPLFDRQRPFDARESQIWRAWAENVFIPSNLKIRDTIEQNAHLLSGGKMPDCFLRILAHIESSKLVLASLADGDLAVLDAFEPWPKDFNAFVEEAYFAAVREHARLLGRSGFRGAARLARAA